MLWRDRVDLLTITAIIRRNKLKDFIDELKNVVEIYKNYWSVGCYFLINLRYQYL